LENLTSHLAPQGRESLSLAKIVVQHRHLFCLCSGHTAWQLIYKVLLDREWAGDLCGRRQLQGLEAWEATNACLQDQNSHRKLAAQTCCGEKHVGGRSSEQFLAQLA